MKINILGAIAVALAIVAAHAQAATVEAVQSPAWLDLGGASVPLTPGTRLQPRDQVRTGGNARVRLRMGEGSAVKLGENAQLAIEVAEDRNVFRAELSVLAGAFRFTTDALAKLLSLLIPTLSQATQTCSGVGPQSSVAVGSTMRVFAYNVWGTNQVMFPTWATVNGQDDIFWYPGINAGGGTWYADVELSYHRPEAPQFGEFVTHVYLYNTGYSPVFCGGFSFTRPAPTCSSAAPQSPTTTAVSGTFRVYAFGVQSATAVSFPTWGDAGGQDDIVWYPGTDAGGGTWYADIDMGSHKAASPEFGLFHSHVYVFNGPAYAGCAGMNFSRVYSSVPPTVTLTAPSQSGARLARGLGEQLYLSASASDDQGIARVQYYANGSYIGQSSTPPYYVGFQPGSPGLYTIQAVAVDISGLTGGSGYGYSAFLRTVPLMTGMAEPYPMFLYHTGSHTTWTLPTGAFYMAVRHTFIDPVAIPVSWDFGRYYSGSNSCQFPLGGGWCTLTGFSPPQNSPSQPWYTRGHVDSTPDYTSAFQQIGVEFGSFLNTWQSGCPAPTLGNPGIHSVYEMRMPMSAGAAMTVFEGDANTEFVIEAELEVPQIYLPPPSTASVQVNLFAYFINNANQLLALQLGAYESRDTESGAPGVGHDGQTIFLGSGIGENQYVSKHPRGGQYVWGTPHSYTHSLWAGKRLYRAFITRAKMQQVLNDTGFGHLTPEAFKLFNAGVIHEISCPGGSSSGNNVSTAYSGRNFRVYAARYY